MTTIHMRYDSAVAPNATLTPDPDRVDRIHDLPVQVALGLACRWLAIHEGECPCGADRVKVNRSTRRQVWGKDQPEFEYWVLHNPGCPATGDPLVRFLVEHKTELGAS